MEILFSISELPPSLPPTLKTNTTQLAPWFPGDVRVNGVAPGGIERGQDISFKDRYISRTISGRIPSENDVAEVICFLLSERSEYVNGQVIAVDGGWTAV
jgi:NAD(P)-dependent dehydrogenase (short-subunit alcohol dehydrogenase family)